MTGIVVVSHSNAASEGICEISAQMTGADTGIEPAGGEENDGLGTSVAKIASAIDRADDGNGVVVLVDLGSSVINTRTALEQVETEAVIADAPLLEGAVNAAVESVSSSATLESVAAAAEEARDTRKIQ